MNSIRHKEVQRVLRVRTERFEKGDGFQDLNDRETYEEALDETGTISTASLTDSEMDGDRVGLTMEAIETLEVSLIDEDLLRVHRKQPGKKEEGVTRLLYENANSISNILIGNEKVEEAKELIDELEADLVAYNEH